MYDKSMYSDIARPFFRAALPFNKPTTTQGQNLSIRLPVFHVTFVFSERYVLKNYYEREGERGRKREGGVKREGRRGREGWREKECQRECGGQRTTNWSPLLTYGPWV